MNKLRVLILSAEVWRNDTNGGNVLSSMFAGYDWEFAQVFCNPGIPDNTICNRYYQMTDSMAISNILHGTEMGNIFYKESFFQNQNDINTVEMPDKKFYGFFHTHRLPIFYFIKHRIWNFSKWKNERLKKFIMDFAPDIVFAPCYGDKFMLRLTRYVYDLVKKPTISYISDDSYTLRQLSFSLFYWIDRFMVRKEMRKTFPLYSLVYTMTDIQKKQCEKDFDANMKILLKPVQKNLYEREDGEINRPIRIVYAGGIYLNRWKTLAKLGKAIKRINDKEGKIRLDIYTQNEVNKKVYNCLDDGKNIFIHKSVSCEELSAIYQRSDIALHVESFDLKNRLAVRMSFSTKITELLASGCAVMAICDNRQGGYDYLRRENAAICIDSVKQVPNVLKEIVNNPKIIKEYKLLANECLERNHNYEKIHNMIERDFISITNKKIEKDESITG